MIRSVVWKEGKKCGLVPAGDLTPGLVCRADLRINMNKKRQLPHWGLATWTPTALPASKRVRHSYGEDKCSPYVYLKVASSPPTVPTLWPSGLLGHFCIHKNRTTPTPSPPHCHFLLLHALIFFSSPSPILCCFPAPLLILPSIVTSLSLSLIHARQPPPPHPPSSRRSPHSSSVTRLSRGESGQEPGWLYKRSWKGWPLPAVCSAPVWAGWRDRPFKRQILFFFGLCACSDLSSHGWQRIVYTDILFKLGRNLWGGISQHSTYSAFIPNLVFSSGSSAH